MKKLLLLSVIAALALVGCNTEPVPAIKVSGRIMTVTPRPATVTPTPEPTATPRPTRTPTYPPSVTRTSFWVEGQEGRVQQINAKITNNAPEGRVYRYRCGYIQSNSTISDFATSDPVFIAPGETEILWVQLPGDIEDGLWCGPVDEDEQ